MLTIEDQWNDCFPWNDRHKRRYRESNCFQVRSKAEDRIERNAPVVIVEPLDNAVDAAIAPPLRSVSRSPSRARTPLPPVPDEYNEVIPRPRSVSPTRMIHTYLLL